MSEFSPLTAKEIESNWNRFNSLIDEYFPDRSEAIHAMNNTIGEEELATMPASSVDFYHNTFAGGYIDHVLRVMDFSLKELQLWKDDGLKIDNFSEEELLFSAMHHDLGKCNLPGHFGYKLNTSKWHRENQGKIYETDKDSPFALIQDKSLFLLQYYGIKMSWNEYLAIRTHDGVYDDANKAYYIGFNSSSKPRTNINQILHNADMRAARFEFERWAKHSGFAFWNSPKPVVINNMSSPVGRPQKTQALVVDPEAAKNAMAAFDELFKF